MIVDTTFLSDYHDELARGEIGRARQFARSHRQTSFLVTAVTAGELAVIFDSAAEARSFLRHYRILRLTPEIAYTAAAVDRELIETGGRLGENDNWIAGFCRCYGQPLVSRDRAFDRVRGLRRMDY